MKFRGIVLLLAIFTLSGHAKSLVFPPYLHSYGIRKATPKHLFMFFGPAVKFDDPQGLATCKMISRDDPKTDKDDDEVVVYGVNAGSGQLIYNTSMWGLAVFGSAGSGTDQFMHPRGVAAEPHGNVFVADSGNNRIVQLLNPSKKARWVRTFDGRGKKGGAPFNGPSQVALDDRCNVYVSDPNNRRLAMFDTGETASRSIKPAGMEFEDGPTTLAVADGRNIWSYFRGEVLIFCADRNGTRLWKLDTAGTVKAAVTVPTGHRCAYAAVDYYHNLWVTDTWKHCVLKFDHNLNLLDVFGSHGTADNQFVEPRGITTLKRFGQTFVAEREGAQYFWIGSDCFSRSIETTAAGMARLHLTLGEYSYISLFPPPAGKDTSFFLMRVFAAAGKWEMDLPSLPRTAAGTALSVRVEPTYSSYTYQSWVYPVTFTK